MPRAGRPKLNSEFINIYGGMSLKAAMHQAPATPSLRIEKAPDGVPVFRIGLRDPLNERSIVISNTEFSAEELENSNSPMNSDKKRKSY